MFCGQLRSIKFHDYLNSTCVNDPYLDFVRNILSVVDFVAPIRALRVKSKTNPCFDIDVLNAIRNRYKALSKIQPITQRN